MFFLNLYYTFITQDRRKSNDQCAKINKQQAKSNEQREKSNDQQEKCNKQRAKSKKFSFFCNTILSCGNKIVVTFCTVCHILE